MRAPRRDVATIAAGVTSAANGSVTIVEDGSSTRLMCRRKERKGPSMGRLARPSHFSHGNSHKQLHPILQCSNPKAEPPGQRQLARPRQDKRSRQPSHLWELQWPTPSQATWRKSTVSQQQYWGEQHPEAVRAKEAWQAAAKDLLRRNPPTLEKQVHTAKEKIGRMQKKVARAKELILTREQELDAAKLAVQTAHDQLDQARKSEDVANLDLSQAQVDYGSLLSKLQAQPGGQSTTGSLLAMVGIQQGQEIPTEVQDAINQVQAMVQSIAAGIKERQRDHTDGLDDPPPEHPNEPPVPPPEGAQAGNPPEATPTADTAQMETDVGDSPAATEEPAAKNLKRDVRGTPTRGSCP